MASSTVCWGIELGAGAVKALKLVRDGDGVSVADFALIPHKRPLSDPDVDEQDAMRVALGTLVTQKDLSKASISISVPGHASFARFAKLPPVEPKKVPDLVKYEADQQIPFPIDEVEWDYQTFISDDEPDIEVGIFAVTRERVMERLAQWEDVKLTPDCLALSPVSVFNAIAYDQHLTADTPGTVILDIGTIATDLIVIEAGRVWIRTFPMGGHAFTEAIASSFKLEYAKAEKLKREAESSKYKRQIFQAMRGTFADFGQDVQRSLQYYQQLHPDANLQRVIGIGSTFKLPGIRKVLSQQLRMDVSRCEGFNRLAIEGPEASSFESVALNMPTAYGLALQGLGFGTIDANLIPVHVARQKVWKAKVPWFAAAAVLSLLAGGASFVKPTMDASAVEQARSSVDSRIRAATNKGNQLKSDWQQQSGQVAIGATASNIKSLTRSRSVYSDISRDINEMIASADPQQELLSAATRDSIPAEDWRMFELISCSIDYKTPSGDAPKWTGPLPGADSSPTSAAQSDNSARDGRSGGGGGRLGGRNTGSGGRNSFQTSTRDTRQGGAQQLAPSAQFGTLTVTMTVNSSNGGIREFVNTTILEWLRTHEDDPSRGYTFGVPDISEVQARQIQTASTSEQGTRSNPESGPLGTIAPLDTTTAGFPENANVYQYIITFEVTLRDPTTETTSDQEVRR
ncbi:MAG: type IV pilus assembly protein PilM [Phycisphaerales bacterium JB043]